jgi:hypothetical protein
MGREVVVAITGRQAGSGTVGTDLSTASLMENGGKRVLVKIIGE